MECIGDKFSKRSFIIIMIIKRNFYFVKLIEFLPEERSASSFRTFREFHETSFKQCEITDDSFNERFNSI